MLGVPCPMIPQSLFLTLSLRPSRVHSCLHCPFTCAAPWSSWLVLSCEKAQVGTQVSSGFVWIDTPQCPLVGNCVPQCPLVGNCVPQAPLEDGSCFKPLASTWLRAGLQQETVLSLLFTTVYFLCPLRSGLQQETVLSLLFTTVCLFLVSSEVGEAGLSVFLVDVLLAATLLGSYICHPSNSYSTLIPYNPQH